MEHDPVKCMSPDERAAVEASEGPQPPAPTLAPLEPHQGLGDNGLCTSFSLPLFTSEVTVFF